MLEVRPGLLLGSMGDALAVLSRVPSITKLYTVTHVLSVCNDPPEYGEEEGGRDGGGEGEEGGEIDGRREEDGESGEKEGEKEGMGKGRGNTRRKLKSMFVQVADMPSSDLLEHFEHCVRFIKEGVEQGTILVHCEHGVSRSVTLVLAYLMWTERLPLKVVFQELKSRKPEIRPNAGFVQQLKLWERMKCRIDKSDKLYRAYQLQHKAREMEESGLVEEVHMSPDPFINTQESTGYFRCRKCRRLLFTDDSLLQHELGEGQTAFPRYKRSHPASSPPKVVKEEHPPSSPPSGSETGAEGGGRGEPEGGEVEPETLSSSLATNTDSSITDCAAGEKVISDASSKQTSEHSTSEGVPPASSQGEDSPSSASTSSLPALTIADLARVRAQVASVVALGNQSSVSSACSSYFIEPVEWMGELLLGEVEGKLLCPKCNARLGSFNWAGEQCSCGRWVTPSFQIHRSRVDETRTLSRRKNVGQGETRDTQHSS